MEFNSVLSILMSFFFKNLNSLNVTKQQSLCYQLSDGRIRVWPLTLMPTLPDCYAFKNRINYNLHLQHSTTPLFMTFAIRIWLKLEFLLINIRTHYLHRLLYLD